MQDAPPEQSWQIVSLHISQYSMDSHSEQRMVLHREHLSIIPSTKDRVHSDLEHRWHWTTASQLVQLVMPQPSQRSIGLHGHDASRQRGQVLIAGHELPRSHALQLSFLHCVHCIEVEVLEPFRTVSVSGFSRASTTPQCEQGLWSLSTCRDCLMRRFAKTSPHARV